MIENVRFAFNRSFSREAAARIREKIVEIGGEITFPFSPTPVFVPRDLTDEMCAAVRLFFRAMQDPDYRREAESWIPEDCRAAGGLETIPPVSQFDFAITRTPGGRLEPHLIECQGCSSLMGIVPWYGHLICQEQVPGFTPFLSHLSWDEYVEDLTSVLGKSILIDVDTSTQRLRADFWILHHFAQIEIGNLCPGTVVRIDEEHPRLYSRIVPAEAKRKGCLDVMQSLYVKHRDWVAHPNWFFGLSKRSLPRLSRISALVPETVDLTAETLLARRDMEEMVLKPANDFGGVGVELHPTPADLAAALVSGEPYMLQRRIEISPLVRTPDGSDLFCELRVLCLEDRPIGLFCRLATDPRVNISFNDHHPWCGITVGLLPVKDESPLALIVKEC